MRMKWKKILAVIAIPVAIAAGTYAYEPPAELIEYHVEADRGDTIGASVPVWHPTGTICRSLSSRP